MIHIRLAATQWKNGERPNCAFANGFRNINLDLGRGNSGAIGLKFGAAQESFLQNVSIEANDGFAGIQSFPGRGMCASNIAITGGRYGFWLPGDGGGSLGGNLAGIYLKGQSQAAIDGGIFRGMSIVGFQIEKNEGPAIIMADKSRGVEGGHLGLYDGRIELANGGPAILNDGERFLVMKNVFVKGHSTEFEETVAIPSSNTGGWTRVLDFGNVPSDFEDDRVERSVNLLDGKLHEKVIFEYEFTESVPDTLVTRHVWEDEPDPFGEKVLNVLDFGAIPNDGLDDVDSLQSALDQGTDVFLPAGEYDISCPLQLGSLNRLFGVPGRRTAVKPVDVWKSNEMTWLIETADDADATTTLSDIALMSPTHEDSFFGALHWRAGRHSVVRNVRDVFGNGHRTEALPIQAYRISGSGGGRWYSWTEHFNIRPNRIPHPDFRKLVVEGTREPMTFYGFNPEHGGIPERTVHPTFVEVIDAKNVRFFGMKAEANGPVLWIERSENVLLGMAFTNPIVNDFPAVVIDWCEHLEIHGCLWPGSKSFLVEELNMKTSDVVGRNLLLGIYRRGRGIDWDAWSDSL